MCAALPARTRIVQSSANRWLKALRSAVAQPPSARASSDALVALEGEHLILEAMHAGLVPAALYLRESAKDAAWAAVAPVAQDARFDAMDVLVIADALWSNAVSTETPQPLAALVAAPRHVPDLGSVRDPLLLVLAAVQDPGNVGTLLRSAEALGATGAVLLPGTATPWSSKALRASAGAALRLPLLALRSVTEARALFAGHGIRSYAAVPTNGTPATEAELAGASAVWIGNEGAGLSGEELAACDTRITIPMPGTAESLNAAVAGSLLLYEASRQRSARASQHA